MRLVVLSVAVAVVASYLALDLTRRSSDLDGYRKRSLIAGAGVTMGVGIWSMHFVGMLALGMDMPVSYNTVLVFLSLLAAVLGASVSLAVVTRPHLSKWGLLTAAAFMGFAVAAMHYLGMASMQMQAVIHWHIGLVILSVAIGLASSGVALALLLRIRRSSGGFGIARQAAAAVLLGIGVAGLHYSAMSASTFTPAMGRSAAGHGLATGSVVVMLSIAAAVMLVLLLGGSAADQRRAVLAADIAVVANIARDLCRMGDSRTRICEAIAELTGADDVSLLESDTHDTYAITASTGRPGTRPNRESTMLREDLVLDGRQIGLLVLSWNGRARPLPERTRTLLEMVAAEAAVAIDRENLLTRLEYLSRRDELTGLLNRRAFNEELAMALGHQRPLSLIMLDIDRFKNYNDTYGHQAGDRLLKSAAAAWLSQLRDVDVIARYGGEEFAVILHDCDPPEARLTADRLRHAIPAGTTCSAGVATIGQLDTAAELIGRADRALYEAKTSGRDQTGPLPRHRPTPNITS